VQTLRPGRSRGDSGSGAGTGRGNPATAAGYSWRPLPAMLPAAAGRRRGDRLRIHFRLQSFCFVPGRRAFAGRHGRARPRVPPAAGQRG
jgi:hypothetical protein